MTDKEQAYLDNARESIAATMGESSVYYNDPVIIGLYAAVIELTERVEALEENRLE